jgi:hypothetical protein
MRVIMNTYGDECGSCCGSSGSSALGATARFQSHDLLNHKDYKEDVGCRVVLVGGGWRVEGLSEWRYNKLLITGGMSPGMS